MASELGWKSNLYNIFCDLFIVFDQVSTRTLSLSLPLFSYLSSVWHHLPQTLCCTTSFLFLFLLRRLLHDDFMYLYIHEFEIARLSIRFSRIAHWRSGSARLPSHYRSPESKERERERIGGSLPLSLSLLLRPLFPSFFIMMCVVCDSYSLFEKRKTLDFPSSDSSQSLKVE